MQDISCIKNALDIAESIVFGKSRMIFKMKGTNNEL